MLAAHDAPPRIEEILPPALLIAIAFMSSTLITPLYALYQTAYHFSVLTLTLIYAVYAVGNLVAVLFFGRVSDRAGRRRVALPALALATVSTLLFILAHGTAWLFAARLLSGFGVGLASGTGTAWLADLYGKSRRPQATLAATCANLAGAAGGPLLGGLLAQYAPMPLELSFYAYLVLLACAAVALTRAPETVRARESDLSKLSFWPKIGVPQDARKRFVAPAVAAFGVWALSGFYFALLPGVLRHDLGVKNVAIAGSVVCEMMLFAVATTIVFRNLQSEKAMLAGLLMQVPSVVLLIASQMLASTALLLVGSAVTGATLGLGYRGSLQVVNQLAPEDRRAGVVSAYFAVMFLGNSVPIVGIGILTSCTSALTANAAFAVTIAIFAIVAARTYRRTGA